MYHAFFKKCLLGCVLAFSLVMATASTAQQAAPYRIVGYYVSWGIYARGYLATEIPAHMLTHINYAFANFSAERGCYRGDPNADTDVRYAGLPADLGFQGNFGQLIQLKRENPGLQTLISVGGWNWSVLFSDVAATPESRAIFAEQCVEFMVQYGFDGIDLDWEYPTGGGHPLNRERPEDPENFILLLEAVRTELDAQAVQDGRPYLLTIAAGAGDDKIDGLDWSRIHPLLDFINVMAYDMAVASSPLTGFNAPLYDSSSEPVEGTSAHTAIQAYLDQGVPADKLVLGVAFYGRGWGAVPPENNGLHQPHNPQRLPSGTWELHNFDYQDIAENHLTNPDFQRFWDDTAQVPWLYNPVTQVMISYDDPESLTVKAEYVREMGLGGVMFWELSGDDDQASLLTSLYETLNAAR
ncbi:MAG: glycoside hydrolase family 18 protein [bacterium]|nr:glycoside hydrolase family 18 protein [bacterium]